MAILAIGGYWLARVLTEVRGKSIRGMEKALGILRDENPDRIAQNYSSLKKKLIDIRGFGQSWMSFNKYLDKGRGKEAPFYSTVPPSEHFSPERLIYRNCSQVSNNVVPPILTGIGIFGTFLGIFIGLGDFSTGDSSTIATSIDELMGGISIAFITSLVGIGSSVLLSLITNPIFARARRLRNRLVDRIEDLFPYRSKELYLARLCERTEEQRDALRSLSEDIVEPIEIAMEKAMQSTMQPALQGLNSAVEDLVEYKKESSESAVGEMIDHFLENISGATTEQYAESSQALSHAAEVLSDSAQRISLMLTQIEDLNASQERAIRGAVDSVTSIEKGAERLKEASATMHGMHATLEELFTKLHSASAEHRESLDSFLDSGTSVANKMEKTATTAGELWNNYSSSFETLSEAIDGGIDRYTNGVSESLERILGEFDRQLSRAVHHLDRILDQMRDNFEELNEYMEDLLKKAGE